MSERTVKLTVQLSPLEQAMLRDVAEARGLTASDVVRQAIRREHAELEHRRQGQEGRQ